eukprot:6174132-Pleurochrysis_carterae.AAC.4
MGCPTFTMGCPAISSAYFRYCADLSLVAPRRFRRTLQHRVRVRTRTRHSAAGGCWPAVSAMPGATGRPMHYSPRPPMTTTHSLSHQLHASTLWSVYGKAANGLDRSSPRNGSPTRHNQKLPASHTEYCPGSEKTEESIKKSCCTNWSCKECSNHELQLEHLRALVEDLRIEKKILLAKVGRLTYKQAVLESQLQGVQSQVRRAAWYSEFQRYIKWGCALWCNEPCLAQVEDAAENRGQDPQVSSPPASISELQNSTDITTHQRGVDAAGNRPSSANDDAAVQMPHSAGAQPANYLKLAMQMLDHQGKAYKTRASSILGLTTSLACSEQRFDAATLERSTMVS